jgi:GTP-binding protein
VTLSALTGAGLRKLLPAVTRVAAAASRRVPTAELNRWLQDVVERHEPGMPRHGKGSSALKFQYASQIGIHPPAFLIFCSDADSVQPAYRRFLENRLRETFGLEGTPIRLRFRSRKRRGSD